MTSSRWTTRIDLLALALCLGASAQVPAAYGQNSAAVPTPEAPKAHRHASRQPRTVINPGLVFIDPAHGGLDTGAHLGTDLLEKSVTLSFGQSLERALAAKGFQVQMSRESDPTAPVARPVSPGVDENGNPLPAPPPPPAQPGTLSADQRAEMANRVHPLACLLLHATSTGHGIHLFTSALNPAANTATARQIPLWDTAQAPVLGESAQLAADLSQSINTLRTPLLSGKVSVAPIDSLSCPAVLVELAPWKGLSVADHTYQEMVANALTDALQLWQSQTQSRLQAEAARAATEGSATTTRGKGKAGSSTPKTTSPRSSATPGRVAPGGLTGGPR